MTVNTTHATSPFTGDGVTDTFLFTFDINPLSYAVEVWIENVLQSEANYSVVPNADQDTSPGGQIIFVTPPTLGDEGEVKRASPLTQLQGFPKSGAINTLATESTFDKVMRVVQEVVLDISENTFRWRGEWSSLLTYQPGDAVYYGGSSYRAINTNLNSAPPSADWQTVVLKGDSGGLTWRNAWSSATSYVLGDGVSHEGGSYICISPHANQEPPNATYWDVLATKGDDGDVAGPGASTNNALALWDGTGGATLKDSGIAPSVANANKLVGVKSDGSAFELQTPPGGGVSVCSEDVRLTLEAGVPVSSADQSAKTTLYCTAGSVKLWTGSAWQVYDRAELSASLSALTANGVYAVYEYLNSGVPALEFEAWSSATARATNIAKDTATGIYHKFGDKTRIHRGDIWINSTGGQCEDTVAFRGVWNRYNRRPRTVKAVDTTDNWSYTTASWRSQNGSTTLGVGQVKVMSGAADTFASLTNIAAHNTSHNNVGGAVGIGINSSTANSASTNTRWTGASTGFGGAPRATYAGNLAERGNSIYPIEYGCASSSNFFGDNGSIDQSGLVGEVWM